MLGCNKLTVICESQNDFIPRFLMDTIGYRSRMQWEKAAIGIILIGISLFQN